MAYHPCPVCGLRFARTTEMHDHVRADHTEHVQDLEHEEKETISVPKRAERPSPGVVHLPW